MSYLEWNIDDADRDYVFEEVKSYDMIEMINLNIRGTTSHYTLPKDVAAGRTVTIRNRDFGYAEEGAYFGVEIILADNTEENSSYYFFFKNQTVSFFFNGTRWFLKDPWPVGLLNNLFRKVDTAIEEGYLDIKEYQDDVKKILFSNISFGDFDPSTIEGRFFRDGEFGVTQEDTFQQHTHHGNYIHSHAFPDNTNIAIHIGYLFDKIIPNEYTQVYNLQTEDIISLAYQFLLIHYKDDIHNIIERYNEVNIINLLLEKITQIPQEVVKNIKFNVPDIEAMVRNKITQTINENWNKISNYLIHVLQPMLLVWDISLALFLESIKDDYPDLASKIWENREQIKILINDYIIENHSEKLREYILDLLINKGEIPYKIADYLKTCVCLIDSTISSGGYHVIHSIYNDHILKNTSSASDDIIEMYDMKYTKTNINKTNSQEETSETRPKNIQGSYIMKCW